MSPDMIAGFGLGPPEILVLAIVVLLVCRKSLAGAYHHFTGFYQQTPAHEEGKLVLFWVLASMLFLVMVYHQLGLRTILSGDIP